MPIKKRVSQIKEYLQKWGITDVVMGISGGIDSALVFEMLNDVKSEYDITIHTMFFKHGLHINEASEEKVINYLNYRSEHTTIDMKPILDATASVDGDNSIVTQTQYAYALMYTMLFRKAQQVGGITFGTTNQDEFELGWFGKTSDMVVDVQPIIDFRKLGVYQAARHYKITDEILGVVPNGDLYTGLSDHEVFGCDYETVGKVLVDLKTNNTSYDDVEKTYPKLYKVLMDNKHKVKDHKQYNPYTFDNANA